MIEIAQRPIGPRQPPFIVAEMSANHGGSLDRALELVDAAADSGADAIKVQTYTPDTMTLDLASGEFVIRDPASPWVGRSLFELYAEARTPWEWHPPIFARAKARGIVAFGTPFDATAVDLLERLEAPCFKIASFEATDLPLLRRVARTGKPLLLSTGMASLTELDEAVEAARQAGCADLVLLKCTSAYPASPTESNLRTIPHLRARFGCEVGLSDHTRGIGVAVASVALGAAVIEKHLTLDRSAGGLDSLFSLEPAELARMVQECRRAAEALGDIHYGPTDSESGSLQLRRSLYVVEDLRAGSG